MSFRKTQRPSKAMDKQSHELQITSVPITNHGHLYRNSAGKRRKWQESEASPQHGSRKRLKTHWNVWTRYTKSLMEQASPFLRLPGELRNVVYKRLCNAGNYPDPYFNLATVNKQIHAEVEVYYQQWLPKAYAQHHHFRANSPREIDLWKPELRRERRLEAPYVAHVPRTDAHALWRLNWLTQL